MKPNKDIARFHGVAQKLSNKANASRGKNTPHPLDKTKILKGEVGNPKKKM